MKTRLLAPLVGLAISFALPTYAQQKDLADPQTTRKILALFKTLDDAINNTDAAAIAALYTRDGVMVTTEGPIIGRQAIQKWFTDLYQQWHPKNHIDKLDGNSPHLIGTAGNELWATGESSETGLARTANLSQSRTIGQRFMFVKPMIGRSGCCSGTIPQTVFYASTRVLHQNRPQRRPRPPTPAPNKLATNFFDDKSLTTL
jgi:ketosteroid isomerase-like protein